MSWSIFASILSCKACISTPSRPSAPLPPSSVHLFALFVARLFSRGGPQGSCVSSVTLDQDQPQGILKVGHLKAHLKRQAMLTWRSRGDRVEITRRSRGDHVERLSGVGGGSACGARAWQGRWDYSILTCNGAHIPVLIPCYEEARRALGLMLTPTLTLNLTPNP